jgi:hypothetical protein
MEATGRVKGALLLARMSYVRGMGPMTANRILERIPQLDRELLEGLLVYPAFWYPTEVLRRLDDAVAETLANGDRASILVDVGHFSADQNFGPTGALHTWVREDDPHALLREIPRIQASLFGSGEHSYERLGDGSAIVRALEGDGHEGDACLTTVGWLRRAIELCGGRDVQVSETRCLAHGEACCEFRCEWVLPAHAGRPAAVATSEQAAAVGPG